MVFFFLQPKSKKVGCLMWYFQKGAKQTTNLLGQNKLIIYINITKYSQRITSLINDLWSF